MYGLEQQFAEGHFPGSLNVGLGGRIFAACAGLFLPKQSQILLVVNQPEEAKRAQAELAGLDSIRFMDLSKPAISQNCIN